MDARIVIYRAGTNTKVGYATDLVSWQASFPAWDVGALELKYLPGSVTHQLIGEANRQADFAVEIFDPFTATWREVRNGRFIGLRVEEDATKPGEPIVRKCPSLGWVLGRMLDFQLNEVAPEGHKDEGKHVFEDKTVGAVVGTLLVRAKTRGGFPIVHNFDAGRDSVLLTWLGTYYFAYEIGTSLLDILRECVDAGRCLWYMDGLELVVRNPDFGDPAPGSSVQPLVPAVDYLEAPTTITQETRVDRVLVLGDKGAWGWAKSSDSSPWGFLEAMVTDSRVKTWDGGCALAAKEVAKASLVTEEHTRKLNLAGAKLLPFVHFQAGRVIHTNEPNGAGQMLTVKQITLTWDGTLSGNIVVGQRIGSTEGRLAAKVAAITGGARIPAGAVPPVNRVVPVTPPAPTGLAFNFGFKVAERVMTPTVAVGWVSPVTTATIRHYLVEWDTGGGWSSNPGQPPVLGASCVCGLPVTNGQTVKVRVAAVTDHRIGAWATATGVVNWGVTPEMPFVTFPKSATAAGVLYVAWDGKTLYGQPLPETFSHVELFIEEYPNVSHKFFEAGNYPIALPVGVTVVPRFRAWSIDGKQATTHGAAVTIRSVLDDVPDGSLARQLASGAVDASKLADGAVTAAKIGANQVTANHLTSGSVTAAKIVAGAITTDKLAAGSVTTATLAADAITADKLAATAIDGKTITGSVIRTGTTAPRSELNSGGLHVYRADGTKTAHVGHTAGTGGHSGVIHVLNPAVGGLSPLDQFVFGGGYSTPVFPTTRRSTSNGYLTQEVPAFTATTPTKRMRIECRCKMTCINRFDAWFAIEAWIYNPATGAKIGTTRTVAKTILGEPNLGEQVVSGFYTINDGLNAYRIVIKYVWFMPTSFTPVTIDYQVADIQNSWTPC